jgi:hypothetical protein
MLKPPTRETAAIQAPHAGGIRKPMLATARMLLSAGKAAQAASCRTAISHADHAVEELTNLINEYLPLDTAGGGMVATSSVHHHLLMEFLTTV